jgi:2',3'-cyclic-nucleotide 2'-phosphodiesterase
VQALAKMLFIGDVVGPLGLATLETLLPGLRAELGVDLCLANGENSWCNGAGIDIVCAERMLAAGVDAITTGNHVFDAPGGEELFASTLPVLAPENLAGSGRSWLQLERGGTRFGVASVIGSREGLVPDRALADARRAVDALEAEIVIVDIHSSWPGEKLALAWFLDGRASAVIGTHTHVPSADPQILPGGTAYLSDAGMTGALHSLIGFAPEDIVRQALDPRAPLPAPVLSAPGVLMGALVTAARGGRALAIEPVREVMALAPA